MLHSKTVSKVPSFSDLMDLQLIYLEPQSQQFRLIWLDKQSQIINLTGSTK